MRPCLNARGSTSAIEEHSFPWMGLPNQALNWPGRLSRMLDLAWQTGLARRPELRAESIIARAVSREGRSPSPGPWSGRLERLCGALEGEARLNPLGRTIAYGQLVRLVRARIRAERLRDAHPELGCRAILQPVFLLGQMRSGTTRMHRLLACDRHFAVNRLFEQLEPVPPSGPIDPRPAKAALAAAMLRRLNPSLAAIHPTGAFAVEEDFGLHAYSIWGAMFEGQWLIPSFAEFVEQADASDAYAEFAGLLRLSGWRRGDEADRRWLLKAPQFSQDVDALLEQFPDARLIVLRRCDEQVVASAASLVWNHARLQSDHVTARAIGAEWLRKTSLRADRLDAALARHPHVPTVSLDFDEVSRDWRSAVSQVYALIGRKLEPATEARMARYIKSSKLHHGHRYSLEEFGLDRRQVRDAFA